MANIPVLKTIPAGKYDQSILQYNFNALAQAFAGVVGTLGTSGTNNMMRGDLDMDDFTIRNAQIDASSVTVNVNAITSINSISAPAGNIIIAAGTGTNVTSNSTSKTITIENLSPLSIDGVSNAGGNIDFIAGTGITITPSDAANTITFATDFSQLVVNNLGVSGASVYKDTTSGQLNLRKIKAGASVTVTENANDIEIAFAAVSAGEANTASNVGSGAGNVFKAKTGVDLEFKTLLAGSNVTITDNASDITIAATGEANTASNVGAGTGTIYKAKTGVDLELKSLVAGTNITITNGASDITIAASGSVGEANTYSSMGSGSDGETLVSTKSGVDLPFKRIKAGNGIVLTSETNDIKVANITYTYNVKFYGALGDNSTDDTAAIQSAIDAAKVTGGEVYFPQGEYIITSQLNCYISSVGILGNKGVSFKGDGAGNTLLKYTGVSAPTTYILDYGTSDTTTPYSGDWGYIKDIGFLSSNSYYINGLRVVRRAAIELSGLKFYNLNYGLELNSVLSSSMTNVWSQGNNYGMLAKNGTSAFSSCNGNTMVDCHMSSNNYGGMDYQNGSVTIIGGSTEGNGASGGTAAYGIKYTRDSSQLGVDPNGITITGKHYFESNGSTSVGKADIWIVHSEVANIVTSVENSNFNRNSTTYCTNNILYEHNVGATGAMVLNVSNCSFQGLSGYTESSLRKYIAVTGAGTYRNIDMINNYWNDSNATPDFSSNGTLLNESFMAALNTRTLKKGGVSVAAPKTAVGALTSTSTLSTSHTDISWTDESDPHSMLSGTTFTVPTGATYASMQVILPVLADPNTFVDLAIYRNGTCISKGIIDTFNYTSGANHVAVASIMDFPVSAGDTFKATCKYGAVLGSAAVNFNNNSGFGAVIVDKCRAIFTVR